MSNQTSDVLFGTPGICIIQAFMAAVYIKYLERSHSLIKHDFLISPRLSILHLGRDLTSYKNFEQIL